MTDSRDVVLVTVDSLRADACGFMADGPPSTPTIDSLARDGTVFETAIAPAPSTNSSVATMLTGHYPNPAVTSDGTSYADQIRHHLRARRTIAERFRDRGYTTGAFTANPWTARFFNYDIGFDHFEDFMDESLSKGLVAGGSDQRGIAGEVLSLLVNWYQGQDMFMSWEAFVEDVEDWLDSVDSPYFLWIFLVDVHMPYLPPASFQSRSRLLGYPANAALFAGRHSLPLERLFRPVLVDSYCDSVTYTDAFLERLVSKVDDALIAVTADHGEAFGEDGVYGHGPAVSEEMTHVPLVIGNGPSNRIDRPISLRTLPELLPAMASGASVEPFTGATAWTRNYDPAVAVRGTRWRYTWRPTEHSVAVENEEGWTPIPTPGVADLGRSIVETRLEGERERKRIGDMAAELANNAPL